VPLNKQAAAQLKQFGGNVRRERVERGLTQERIAEMADLNLRTIQKIEAGQLNILLTTVIRIHRALACPWGKLLKEK
jgi:transcriptional regulator with XRE-family HTH domain